MKHRNYILLGVLLMGIATVSMAADKSDNTSKSDKSAMQKAAKSAAKELGTGANNLVDAIKEMPDAVGKAAKNIKSKDKSKKDEK